MSDTSTILPRVEVPAPSLVPYPSGLFSVVSPSPFTDVHAEAGVWWRGVACGEVGLTTGTCTIDSPVEPKDYNVVCSTSFGTSFTVYARSNESLGGSPTDEKFEAARQQLLAGEQWAVERFLWDELVASITPVTGNAGSFQEGVAMAEQLIAWNYGGAALLHLSRYSAIMAQDALVREGGRLLSLLGTPVVAGGGYGDNPPAVTPGQSGLVIATGPLVIFRSEIIENGRTYDQAVNSVDALVERTYVIGWDCAAIAVLATPTPTP